METGCAEYSPGSETHLDLSGEGSQGRTSETHACHCRGHGGSSALDTIDAPYFRRTRAFNQFNKTFSGTNMGVGTVLVPLSFYAISLVRENAYGQHTSLLAGEAVADAEILTMVMKDVDRRLRPSDIPP